MDPAATPPQPESPTDVVATEEISLGRKISWIALMILLVVPAVMVAGSLGVQLIPYWILRDYLHLDDAQPQLLVLLALAGTAAFFLGRAGLRRGWPKRGVLLAGWVLVCLGGLGLFRHFRDQHRLVEQKIVQGHLAELRAAANQFYLEHGVMFASYDDLVGPTRYVRAIQPVAGEDYRSLGLIRQDHVDELRIKLADGRVISLSPPPDVPDGLQVDESGDRYETTYRNKVPDGPTRIVTKKGEVLFTGNYVEGHLVGPCWYRGRDLNDPANGPPDVLGRKKLAAQDYKQAEADFTRALADEPSYENYVGRADARLGQGQFDSAVGDYLAAQSAAGGSLRAADLPKLQRARAGQGAEQKARDVAAVSRQKQWLLSTQGSSLVQIRDYSGAEAIFTRVIAVEPDADVFAKRSDVRYLRGNLEGALADLSESIRLTHAPPAFMFLKRAWLYRVKNDLPAAAAEFRAVAGAQPDNVNYRGEACHAACWLYFVECERGQAQAAAEELARTIAQLDRLGPTADVWYRLEAELLLGHITEDQLLAKVALPANQSGDANRFQALFFSGLLRQRAGDSAGALDRFQRALQTSQARQFIPDVLEAQRVVAAGK